MEKLISRLYADFSVPLQSLCWRQNACQALALVVRVASTIILPLLTQGHSEGRLVRFVWVIHPWMAPMTPRPRRSGDHSLHR
jgi:hypothetical protein